MFIHKDAVIGSIEMKANRILVPTSGYLPAKERGEYIIEVARRLEAEIYVVHVRDPNYLVATTGESEGKAALNHFEDLGLKSGVRVYSHFLKGELVPTLMQFVKENRIDLILMGSSTGSAIADWIVCDLMDDYDIPILIVPQDFSDLI